MNIFLTEFQTSTVPYLERMQIPFEPSPSYDREFDMVIFGASGFTGKFVVRELCEVLPQVKGHWKVALAGRSTEKLLKTVEEQCPDGKGIVGLVPTVEGNRVTFATMECDANDNESLRAMASRTRIVVSTVGPFRHHAADVISACINAGAHYVDVCGEPEVLETVEARFGAAAALKKTFIVQSCGFDSVPADLGVQLTRSLFHMCRMTQVETYLTIATGSKGMCCNRTTYDAAVLGFSSAENLRKLRREIPRPQLHYSTTEKMRKKQGPFSTPELPGKVCYMFPGADHSVIMRTQYLQCEQKPTSDAFQVACYVGFDDTKANRLRMTVYGGIFNFCASSDWGRRLLLSSPSTFSGGVFTDSGPTTKQVEECSFTVDFVARGFSQELSLPFPDEVIHARMCGPDPAYKATCSMLVASALTILGVSSAMSGVQGGVLTPGFVFGQEAVRHAFVKLLAARRITFEIREKRIVDRRGNEDEGLMCNMCSA